MYVKNVGMAVLETAFRLTSPDNLLNEAPTLTPRVAQLCLFLDQNYNKLSLFDDAKAYFEDLSFVEARYLVDTMLPRMTENVSYCRRGLMGCGIFTDQLGSGCAQEGIAEDASDQAPLPPPLGSENVGTGAIGVK